MRPWSPSPIRRAAGAAFAADLVAAAVGPILYDDLEQTIKLWEAGRHDLVSDTGFDGVFCAALG
jgi:hypothetical protein